jgi:hypothetical protein
MSDQPPTIIIPIFPLTLVQFPGAITPLHIFEERYRKMLRDVLSEDKIFGITCLTENDATGEPPIGRVGCAIEVIAHQTLPDGRSNILCAGGQRYRTLRHLREDLYLKAEIEFFRDEPEKIPDTTLQKNRSLFERVIAAEKKIKDTGVADQMETPELPEDPQALSFMIAASLDLSNDEKQSLLEMTSTRSRLKRLGAILEKLAAVYERRAVVHHISKSNGHGGPVNI